jgi:endonuclease YncB( thermonuclease family)
VARAAATACTCAVLSLAAGAAAAGIETMCPGLQSGPTRTVTRILDPETVVLDDGKELRLIGALAPRAIDADADPGTWPAETAASEALRALVLGKSVALGFAGERADRYGRTQAHAFLVVGEERRWVQRELIEGGFARIYALAGNRACAKELLAAEQAAREARRGLWAEAAYQVRAAHKPTDLLRYRATFQVVEGNVVRVGLTRGTIYLNFDRNWRRGFSVSLRRDDSALLGDHGDRPRTLEQKRVRVRGWIDERNGAPALDLSAAGMLEVLGEPAAPTPR